MKETTRQRLWAIVEGFILVVIVGTSFWAIMQTFRPLCPPCQCGQVEVDDHWSFRATKEYLRLEREGLIEPGKTTYIKLPE